MTNSLCQNVIELKIYDSGLVQEIVGFKMKV